MRDISLYLSTIPDYNQMLAGKNVLITTAARGIGKSIALLFARQGADVYFGGRNEEYVRTTEKELQLIRPGCRGYVVDLAKAHVKAIERMLGHKSEEDVEIFNLGTGQGVSVLELIHTFEEATGIKLNYRIAERREGDITQVWADPQKANTILGWKAETPLAETLKSAWKWQLHLREKGIM